MQTSSTLFGTTPTGIMREFWNTKDRYARNMEGMTEELYVDTDFELNEYEKEQIRDGLYDGIVYVRLHNQEDEENALDIASAMFKLCYKTKPLRKQEGVSRTRLELRYPYMHAEDKDDDYHVTMYLEHEEGRDIEEERKEEVHAWKDTFNRFLTYVVLTNYKEYLYSMQQERDHLANQMRAYKLAVLEIKGSVQDL